ncbi:MAG: GyrI-like domain-containing protein [Anaerolineales bacterium]|nr:GyrI-like domain-containing protein [Anaerolineales bacterium]
MIKIGDFSKLAHVSVKTLHHYDELGLLKPAHVDRYTGYRYYQLEQMARLNRILALKDLGFALEQVAQLLDEELSTAEMRGMLRLKRIELAEQVQHEQARLASVERRLRQLEREGRPPEREIALKEVPAQTVLTARTVAASEEALFPARQSLQRLLQNQLERARLKPATPWFALVPDLPFGESDLEVELAVGVQLQAGQRADDWGSSPIRLRQLPAISQMASLIHADDYSTLPAAYTQLYAWTQANGYQITGSCREIYLTEDEARAAPFSGPLPGMTEVQCPVAPASIPLSILSPAERKEQIMEPKIVTKPAFKAVGLSYVGKNQAGEIHQMWTAFNRRSTEIPSSNTSCCYGLCFSQIPEAAEGKFEYVAACEVADDQHIPHGMVYREVPAYKYAIFTHHGKLDKLGETYGYIYNTWLPQSGQQVHPDKFDMEVYDEDFCMDSDESKFYIYVAIQ